MAAQKTVSKARGALTWHLEQLDALRGLAVTGVVCIHCAQFIPSPAYQAYLTAGQRGVQLFFVVSAFTLFLSYQNRKAERRPTVNFFVRRFFRLAPMYYVALILGQAFAPVLHTSKANLVLSAFLMHGLRESAIVRGVFGGWSMGDEALFYCCLPFLFRAVKNLNTALKLFLYATPPLIILSQYLAIKHGDAHWGFYLFTWFPAEFPIFLMGIIAFFYWQEYVRPNHAFAGAKVTSALLLLAVIAIYFVSLPVSDWRLQASSAACPILLMVVLLHPWKLLVNRFTIYLGKISYSIYLLHFFWLWVIFPKIASRYHIAWRTSPDITPKMVAAVVVVLGLTIPVADLTWRYIETPGIKLGRWLISKWEKREVINARVAETPDAQF